MVKTITVLVHMYMYSASSAALVTGGRGYLLKMTKVGVIERNSTLYLVQSLPAADIFASLMS